MADQDSSVVRKVAWSELFPWLILARSFRIAIQPRQLALGALGILLTVSGWFLLGAILSGNQQVRDAIGPSSCPWLAVDSAMPNWPAWPEGIAPSEPLADGADAPIVLPKREAASATEFIGKTIDPLRRTWWQLSWPFVGLFDMKAGVSGVTFLLLCGLWAAAVWGFFGAAITRSAAIQLATGQRDQLVLTVRYAVSKWQSYFAAPVIPVIGVFLIAVPLAIAGLLLRVSGLALLAALVWPVLLLGGFLIALLMLGLAVGWPLLWAHLSTEDGDSFDAVGRMYHYVYQRPFHYLFYAVVATFLGSLGWFVVWVFTDGIVAGAYWAASWGAGAATLVDEIISGESPSARLIHFWVQCVRLLGIGFLFSYFWTTSSAIYYLLRYNIDATEMDEVLPEQEEEPVPLPPIRSDSQGAPVMDNGRTEKEGISEQPLSQ